MLSNEQQDYRLVHGGKETNDTEISFSHLPDQVQVWSGQHAYGIFLFPMKST